MTTAREWPNKYRVNRDKAAQEIAAAQAIASKLIRSGRDITQADRERATALINDHLQNALRWLESAGAPTSLIERIDP